MIIYIIIAIVLYIVLCLKTKSKSSKTPPTVSLQRSKEIKNNYIKLQLLKDERIWINEYLEATLDETKAASFEEIVDKEGNKYLKHKDKFITMDFSKIYQTENNIVYTDKPNMLSYLSIRKTPKTNKHYIKFKSNFYFTISQGTELVPQDLQKSKLAATMDKNIATYFIIHRY